MIFVFTNVNPLSTITGSCFGQKVQIHNNYASSTVQVTNTPTVKLKGGAHAQVLADYGILTLVNTNNSILVEESRNF